MALDPITARCQLLALFEKPEPEIDLARAALLVSAELVAGVEIEACLDEIDRMADEVRPRLAACRSDLDQLLTLNHYLFSELGFRGNEDDYYDPRNSFLHELLGRRLGIPISLAVVTIEVGRRIGVPIEGIAFPGHFLVRHARQRYLIFDPFHGGDVLTLTECAELFSRVAGADDGFESRYLQPAGAREMMVRLVTNLKSIYLKQNRVAEALRMVELLLCLQPGDPQNLRDRGLLRVQAGELGSGIEDLETYLALDPEPPDQQTVEALIARAREGSPTVH
ncbi:MAG TPA: transglutaminase-like domain-containing protein [Thermoanaerobaculia bacterium]|nr:transglutaminase-like domain-containing protein [Thermoanaerobaculia bacterium]